MDELFRPTAGVLLCTSYGLLSIGHVYVAGLKDRHDRMDRPTTYTQSMSASTAPRLQSSRLLQRPERLGSWKRSTNARGKISLSLAVALTRSDSEC